MAREWITPIYDRTYGNILDVQNNPDQENPKGCWNAIDLNRIENNTAYCAKWMYEKKIIRFVPEIEIKEDGYWTGDKIPTQEQISRIINNVRLLINYSMQNPAIADRLPTIYSATQINYVLANQIEFALDLMHNQPKLPLDYWTLKINNGIVTTIIRDSGVEEHPNSSEVLVAEDEIVTIKGVEYGEYAQYQNFTTWSGAAEDVGLLRPNSQTQTATLTYPYRNVELTANFETHIPRTLTLTNAYISTSGDPSASSGPTTGQYFAGDRVMIIANVAPTGRAFYEWLGTQAGLDNIVGVTSNEDPSTAWLTMPDEDVQLQPKYVYAGNHTVTVYNGTVNGNSSGSFAYGTNISISATIPNHYRFVSWTGDYVNYLSDPTSPYQSFTMKDENIWFRATTAYQYSVNNVQVIDGYIVLNNTNVTSGSITESNSYTLVPTPPDDTYGLYNWTIEGAGSVSGNTFRAGDGNSIITGNYRKYRTLTGTNINNNESMTRTSTVVEGQSWTLSTNETVDTNYKFNGWYENGTRISTSPTLTLTAGNEDRVVEARYDYYPTYTVTVINRNNNGTTTTYNRVSGSYFTIDTTEDVGSKLFTGWSGDRSSSSTSMSWYISRDVTITANYRDKETYTLTVNNGSGSGDYLERTWVNITANASEEGYAFNSWSYSGIRSINNQYNSSTSVQMGRQNATVTATYANTRIIQIVRNNGTLTYTVQQGDYTPYFDYGTPADGKRFKEWQLTSGDATIGNTTANSTRAKANEQDSVITAIYEDIPTYTVSMTNGEIQDSSGNWVNSATLRVGSTNAIRVKQGSVPLNHQFLVWEIYVNGVLQTDANDVSLPYAETTSLRGLSRDITIKATFYQPDPETTYKLKIYRIDGSVDINDYSVGATPGINASTPPEGKEFWKWTGDTAYLGDNIGNSTNWVRMPAQDVELTETYVNEGYIPTYHLYMTGVYGECCYTTEQEDPETGEIETIEHWVTDHEYPENTEVRIRTVDIEDDHYFNGWSAKEHAGSTDVSSIIKDRTTEESIVVIPDYNVDVEPSVLPKQTYELKLNNGLTGNQNSAYYYEGKRADVRFAYTDTDDIHYNFTRWTGNNITDIELWDGGMFDVTNPGSEQYPQYIKMPGRRVEITGNYSTLFRITVNNGTIDGTSGLNKNYYVSGTELSITANEPPAGMTFRYWTGDTDVLSSKYDPTPTLTTVTGTTTLTAVYSTIDAYNDTGYVNTNLKNTTNIDNNDITVISGEIEVGFIITDSLGHIYTITNIDSTTDTSTILRLTKVYKGGNIYE